MPPPDAALRLLSEGLSGIFFDPSTPSSRSIHRHRHMVQLDENRFLNELGKLFDRAKASGSVWITMKSSNNKPRSKSRTYPEAEYGCLVRAVASGTRTEGGKRTKKREIATLVPAASMSKFQQSMSVILKVCSGHALAMQSMRHGIHGWMPQRGEVAFALVQANMDGLKKKEKSKAPRRDA